MAKLSQYQTKAEKQAVFTNCVFCDSENDVHEWLTDLDAGRFDGAGMAFRGLSNASYKLFSSLQRKWIEQDLSSHRTDHKALVQSLLDRAFQHEVSGTMRENGERDELAMLSYLQHHGCPTPFLDFTSDIRVALFFASQESKNVDNGSELDKYFSVYVFHPEIPRTINLGLEKAWRNFSPGRRDEVARCFRSYEMNSLQETLIFDPGWINQVYGEGVVSLSSSIRFERQSGLFTMNNTAVLPFPEAIHAFVDAGTGDEQKRHSVRTWINCLNIHRDHARAVQDWLAAKDPPITLDQLLPDREEHQWVKELLDTVLYQEAKSGPKHR